MQGQREPAHAPAQGRARAQRTGSEGGLTHTRTRLAAQGAYARGTWHVRAPRPRPQPSRCAHLVKEGKLVRPPREVLLIWRGLAACARHRMLHRAVLQAVEADDREATARGERTDGGRNGLQCIGCVCGACVRRMACSA